MIVLIAEGLCPKEIAPLLGISPDTVNVHKQNLMRKLDLHGIAHICRYAVETDLVDWKKEPS